MIVTTIQFPAFHEDLAPKVIQTLTQFRRNLKRQRIDGFMQSYLLRETRDGSALLVTVWESRRAMHAFSTSEEGKAFRARLAEVIGNEKAEFHEYRASWQGHPQG